MASDTPIINPSRCVSIPASAVDITRTLTTSGSIITASPAVILPPKSSADVLDYTLDYTQWLAGDGDTISGYSISDLEQTETDTPLTVLKSWQADQTISFILSSGVPSTAYNFAVTIQTAAGYAYYQPIQITLKDSANATAPASFPTLPNTLATIVYVSENLPIEDPNNLGQIWVNGGYLMVSAG